ncbi:unnamed protein product [Echinostoma caproni]|uniref:Uncharacterized protein n=1 Tax=Echinostoma caproni TaxID=27848 RepID=A0A3P8I199_9TREM|nr:unnamed protein product [Echinostoma caproni]
MTGSTDVERSDLATSGGGGGGDAAADKGAPCKPVYHKRLHETKEPICWTRANTDPRMRRLPMVEEREFRLHDLVSGMGQYA